MNDAGFQFSSANSINIGRLVPQIVYYVYAYAKFQPCADLEEAEENIYGKELEEIKKNKTE